MVISKAATVQEYLDELPEERRAVVSAVRDLIVRNLPEGYHEMIGAGMIGYGIPLEDYPDTYNGQPLGYAGLAAQKHYYALYLLGVYADSRQEAWLRDEFRKAGKKLDMGKCCVRFKKLDDLPLDAIGQIIASTPPAEHIEVYEEARRQANAARQAKRAK
ncbi:MAG TPA: DUF1801 domain-containing protein [Longimicrobium sp.]|nr:DUF1801 domain-containing protein [Longimicrobium sp.]